MDWRAVRRRAWTAMEQRPTQDPVGRLLNGLLIALILGNVVAVILETVPAYGARYAATFFWIEVVSVAVFTLEYLGRAWWAVEDPRYAHPVRGRLRYLCTPLAIIDLLAILPFYLGMLLGWDLRMLRLVRLLRILKLSRYSPAVTILRDVLREERDSLLVTFIVLLIILVLASSGIYLFEHEAQPEAFGSIPAAMWWAVATLTTVGYGDVTPVTAAGKFFAALVTLTGIGMVSLPAGIVASGFTEALRQRREEYAERVEEAMSDGHISQAEQRRLERLREDLGLSAREARRIERRARREWRRQREETDQRGFS